MMNRRRFLLGLGTAAAVIAAPELLLPQRTFFLPPAGGWRTDFPDYNWWGFNNPVVSSWHPYPSHPYPIVGEGKLFCDWAFGNEGMLLPGVPVILTEDFGTYSPSVARWTS